MSIGAEVALLSDCEFCRRPTACLPGPCNQRGRPAPINGYELGYEIEQKERFVLCDVCLVLVLNPPNRSSL